MNMPTSFCVFHNTKKRVLSKWTNRQYNKHLLKLYFKIERVNPNNGWPSNPVNRFFRWCEDPWPNHNKSAVSVTKIPSISKPPRRIYGEKPDSHWCRTASPDISQVVVRSQLISFRRNCGFKIKLDTQRALDYEWMHNGNLSAMIGSLANNNHIFRHIWIAIFLFYVTEMCSLIFKERRIMGC